MIPLHYACGVLSLLSGLAVLLLPKGTRLHRRTGYVYAASMVALCAGSFGIRDTTPFFRGLGAFHVMALLSLGTLAAGLRPLLLRRRRPAAWYEHHVYFMLWSYVGLVMALNSHFVRPLLGAVRGVVGSPGASVAVTVLLVWVLPALAGRRLVPWAAERNRARLAGPPPAP